jgi:RNA polymerase sigma-70 factor (ECF subfamily)
MQAARGDEAAFAALYDRLAPAVFGVVRRVVRDQAQSEEVAQEVFLSVWRSAGGYDRSVGSASAWVLTIAHRRAVDRIRSNQRASEREQKAGQSYVAQDDVASRAQLDLEHERVRRCLESLTELQRESVSLAYYGGYSYSEVADLLQLSVGTVKTRIRDGLIRLRDCLGVEP